MKRADPLCVPTPAPVRRSVGRAGLALWALGVLGLRAYYTTLLPINTGDITRHLYYGLATGRYGLAIAEQPLIHVSGAFQATAWNDLPYGYPVVTLLFFTAVAAIHPSLFFARALLTVIEAYNSFQLYKLTRKAWIGVLYWSLPASIWWASREGQFEPLQALFMFSALRLLRIAPWAGFACLALAIQTKLTAVLLLPFFLYTAPCWRLGIAHGCNPEHPGVYTI